jgi:hypothetical protein
MKDVPAARGRHDFGLDLGEQTLGLMMEVARMRITEAGWQALALN